VTDVTLVTPTYAGDRQCFAFLRESIERCGIDLPHVAIVDHEDLSLFDHLEHRNNLTLLSTRDVLPTALEARRLARQTRVDRLVGRRAARRLRGWYAQQLVKLAAPTYVDTDACVMLDSDVFFVRPVTAADFVAPSGKLQLLEREGLVLKQAEHAMWQRDSAEFLGTTLDAPIVDYTASVVPMHRGVLLDLQSYVEQRHGMQWMEAFEHHRVMEYTTYGVYARWVDELRRTEAARPTHTVTCWDTQRLDEFGARLASEVEHGEARAGVVHSHERVPVESYRHFAEHHWSVLGGPEP
jgi:hypothetical protein